MKKTLFLLTALASIATANDSSTPAAGNYIFAASTTQSGDVTKTVEEGSTGNHWAAAYGNATSPDKDDNTLEWTGNISMTFTDNYTGGAYEDKENGNNGTTVFGIVNAGKVTGDVSLVFDAADANYGSFTKKDTPASVVGAFNGSIGGTFCATINSGTFAKAIMGGIHTGDATDSIGATSIVINGGSIGGNIYGGGVTGTISGDTAVSITNINALSGHTADNIINAGGIGGTINGNSSVTFSDVSGSYAGTVSGGDNVQGSSQLNITGSSELSLNNVEDFDTIDITDGTSLTVTGNLSGGSIICIGYDTNSGHILNKTNGLSNAFFDFSNYITGEGTFNIGKDATYNGKAINASDAPNDRTLNVADAMYYVTGSNEEYSATDAAYTYVLSPEKSVTVAEVVHIGEYSGSQGSDYTPIPNSEANSALAYYVEQGGTLAISGDSKVTGLSAGQMLVNTFGDGDIILRASGYDKDTQKHENTQISISEATKATGNLYITPKILASVNIANDSQPVTVLLEDGANISSFNSVTIGSQVSDIAVNGLLGSNKQGHHINNLQLLGSSFTNMYINTSENNEIVLGGTTTLRSYKYYDPEEDGHTGAQLLIAPNQSSTVRIEHLSSGDMDAETAREKTSLYIQSAYDDAYSHAEEVNAVVHIDSFDFRGAVQINGAQVLTGTIDVNITLKDNQWISSDQYSSFQPQRAKQKPSLTLKGTGTYILEDTKDIIINIGRLSTEVKDGKHIWQGTVQLSNLNATSESSGTGRGMDFAYYGNEQSTVDIRGFKGDVVRWSESGTVDTAQPESVEIVSALKLTNTDSMNAYEVTGGIATQNYSGSISGEGDFVVSATDSKDITLSGDISEWKGNLEATAGEQSVTLSGKATTVNAAIAADGAGKLRLTVDNSDKSTTFNKAVNVTALTVADGSTAKLTAESTVGTVKISGEAVELSGGISITEATLLSGNIANGSITSTATKGTVELDGISATNLRLYGEEVTFHSDEADVLFMAEEADSCTEVSFSSDIFSGMTLADTEALASLTVSNTIDGAAVTELDRTNVTIFLEGFTMESLKNGSGEWDWNDAALRFDTTDTATFGDGVTVSELLSAEYASVTYRQTANGLTIRMQNIPEPTGSALGLVGLVALTLRRRRK